MKLVRIGEAARMLGVDAETLRRRSKNRETLEIYGSFIRVYRMDSRQDAERRFDANEIRRLLDRMRKRQEG